MPEKLGAAAQAGWHSLVEAGERRAVAQLRSRRVRDGGRRRLLAGLDSGASRFRAFEQPARVRYTRRVSSAISARSASRVASFWVQRTPNEFSTELSAKLACFAHYF